MKEFVDRAPLTTWVVTGVVQLLSELDRVSRNSRLVDLHAPHGTRGDRCENVSAGNTSLAYDDAVGG